MLMVMPDTSTSSGESGRCFDDERIKIVPHIGWRAGIGDRDFDIELDDNIATWFEGFRDNFKTFKKGPVISQRLQMFYMNTRNPYEWSLKLFANCPDHNSPKSNSLAYTGKFQLLSSLISGICYTSVPIFSAGGNAQLQEALQSWNGSAGGR